MKKEVWFGLTIMALVVLSAFILLPSPSEMANGHLGLLMLARLQISKPRLGDSANAGPDGSARLFGHVKRCADLYPFVCVHGLPH